MSLTLKQIVPWGRSLEEYRSMFDLTAEDLQRSILDCGGGPASFNAEMTQLGYSVISCDPIYQFTASEIDQRIQESYPLVIAAAQANREKFVWKTIASPEELGKVRMAAMQKFLLDFPAGRKAKRYVTEELPNLSFQTGQFDLALCSHLLFTYTEQLSVDFHRDAILELCRVASEVRIFPLLVHSTGDPSPFLQPVMHQLAERGYQAELRQVPYEFQRNGNQLLRVVSPR